MVTSPQDCGLIRKRHNTWLPVSQRAKTRTWGNAAGAGAGGVGAGGVKRTKGNSATRPPDKRQTLLGLARRRAAVTLDGAALFVIDANCHGPPSRDGFAAPCHLA